MLRCSKFGTGRLVCSKSGLEKVMKFALTGLLTSLSRHLGLQEAKYLSQIGFRNRPLFQLVSHLSPARVVSSYNCCLIQGWFGLRVTFSYIFRINNGYYRQYLWRIKHHIPIQQGNQGAGVPHVVPEISSERSC